MEMYQRQNSACVREQYAPRHARHARSIARTRHASASRSAAAGSAPMSRGVPAGQSSPASGFGCWRGASRGAMAVRRRRSHIAGISRAAGCGADRCESQRAVRRAAPPLCRRLPRRPAPRAALRPQRALRACAVAEPRPRRPTRALPFPFPCVGPGSCDQRKRSGPGLLRPKKKKRSCDRNRGRRAGGPRYLPLRRAGPGSPGRRAARPPPAALHPVPRFQKLAARRAVRRALAAQGARRRDTLAAWRGAGGGVGCLRPPPPRHRRPDRIPAPRAGPSRSGHEGEPVGQPAGRQGRGGAAGRAGRERGRGRGRGRGAPWQRPAQRPRGFRRGWLPPARARAQSGRLSQAPAGGLGGGVAPARLRPCSPNKGLWVRGAGTCSGALAAAPGRPAANVAHSSAASAALMPAAARALSARRRTRAGGAGARRRAWRRPVAVVVGPGGGADSGGAAAGARERERPRVAVALDASEVRGDLPRPRHPLSKQSGRSPRAADAPGARAGGDESAECPPEEGGSRVGRRARGPGARLGLDARVPRGERRPSRLVARLEPRVEQRELGAGRGGGVKCR
jgi:hypothetical protein